MPMLVEVRQDLEREEQSDFHKKMLALVRDQIKASQETFSGCYADWDRYDETYRGMRLPDEKDKKAAERKEPQKMVVPMTYAQVMTWVAYCVQLYFQRPTFFELNGTGVEDWRASKIAEAVLQRDLEHNIWLVKVYQFLLDLGRFGLGGFKHHWCRETAKVWQKQQSQVPGPLGTNPAMMFAQQTLQLVEQVKFLGNKIVNISPYRLHVDPNVSLTEFQDGSFCGSEQDVSRTWLRKQDSYGVFAGTRFVKDMEKMAWNERVKRTRTTIRHGEKGMSGVLLTEMQTDIIPNEFDLGGGKKLGSEDYPIRYVVNIANDSRVIRCEPLNYLHGHYTYSLAQFSPDQHAQVNAGIAELIDQLQDVQTWLINSRITSVRKTIQNQLVVDPEGVNMKDIENRNPVIRLTKRAGALGIDRWLKQLNVNDVTASHIADAEAIGALIRVVTGVSDNAATMYSSGRRSAEQSKSANAASSMRLRLPAMLAYAQAIKPLGEDMLSNLRDGLDEQQIVRVIGLQVRQPLSPYAVNQNDLQNFLGITKADLVGNYDFIQLDATQPSEKQYFAEQLQQLLIPCISNPQAIAILGIDAKALLQEILELLGIRNPERFLLMPAQQQALLGASTAMAQGAGGPGQAAQVAAPAVSAGITSQTAGQPQSPLDALMAQLQLGGGGQVPALTNGY